MRERAIALETPAEMVRTGPRISGEREARRRVMLADDSPQIRDSLGRLLRRANYDVTFAAHGGHVLDAALNDRVDLVLLDLNMPELNGWDALDRMATLKPDLPIIVITAQPDQRAWAMASGARAFMEKPLDVATLLRTVADLLEPGRWPRMEAASEWR